MKHIAVIGEICLDIIMHYPNSIEVYGEKIWAEDVTLTYGGSAALTSAALARLGRKVQIYGTIGDDSEGERIIQLLIKEGVDCSKVVVEKGVQTTRSMLRCTGARKEFLGCSPMLPIQIPPIETLDTTELIYVAGFVLYPELGSDEAFAYYREAAKRGIPIVTDGQCFGIESIDARLNEFTKLMEMIPVSNVFLAAQKEIVHFRTHAEKEPEIAGMLLNLGLDTIIFKRGKDGAVLYEKGKVVEVPGYTVDAYDTIGSGDIFGAGFTYGLVQGWNSEQCLRFASVFAALSLERYQSAKEFPSVETVTKCVNNYYGGNNA